MNKLVTQQVHEVVATTSCRKMLECEAALRVSAVTLRSGAAGEITATTVVCGADAANLGELQALVADIADEFGLSAAIREHSGAYSVRFSCPGEPKFG